MNIRDVADISSRDDGHVVTLRGMLLVSKFVCFLVPRHSVRSMEAVRTGLRVACPGLAAEILECDAARITNGQPEASIEVAAITGVVDLAKHADSARGLISGVSELRLHTQSGESQVDLGQLTSVSKMKMENVNYLQDETIRAALLDKYTKERLQ